MNNSRSNQLKKSKALLEKVLAIFCVGVTKTLQFEFITIDEAEQLIFSPAVLHICNELQLDKNLISIIDRGLFIEDHEEIHPAGAATFCEILYLNAMIYLGKLDPEKDKLDFDLPKWIVTLAAAMFKDNP